MKRFMEEFRAFALRGNMMDMAVGIIIGSAFSGIVTSLSDNLITPLLNLFTTGQTYTLTQIGGFISAFLSSLINFFIMAFILFCMLKAVNRLMRIGRKQAEEAASPVRICPYCRSEIASEATRCPHCTSMLEPQQTQKGAR